MGKWKEENKEGKDGRRTDRRKEDATKGQCEERKM
jgi:hypothetical protein